MFKNSKKSSQIFTKIKIAGALILGLALAVGGSLWLVRAQESDSRVNHIAWHFRCICEMNYGGVITTDWCDVTEIK